MSLEYHVVDVFTEKRFGGNPLAVVLDADELDGRQMQAIAREFNLPETVFVLKPQNRAHTARMRIFTPTAELPFAGHPTVGTAALLGELRMPAGGDRETDGDALIVTEQQIGIVRAGVRMRPGRAPFAEFDAPRLPQEDGMLPPTERIAAALGLIPAEIGFENHRPTRFTAGNAFAFVPVASLEAMEKARVATAHWEASLRGAGLVGAFLYCRQTIHTSSSFHARMFAPDMGIPEDPATGSAAAAFAGVLLRFDVLPDGTHKKVVEQGFQMGRPSLIALSLETEGGKLTSVRVGGHVVRVAQGRLQV